MFERIRELTGQAPVERYGMSETMITLAVRADGERRPGWVGVPVEGVEVRLRAVAESTTASDVTDADVPADGESIGELQVRGACLFDGYLDRPEATAATWTDDGWFRTGDAAVVDEAGYHRIVGRRSVDLIKSGGYRIGAGEVETALLAYAGITEAAVVGEPDDDLGQRIVAHVVCPDGPVDAEAVMDFVGGPALAAQAPARGRRGRRAPPQRHGQGAEGAPAPFGLTPSCVRFRPQTRKRTHTPAGSTGDAGSQRRPEELAVVERLDDPGLHPHAVGAAPGEQHRVARTRLGDGHRHRVAPVGVDHHLGARDLAGPGGHGVPQRGGVS